MNEDHTVLRELARRVRQIAENPAMSERRQRWRDLNGLRPQRPMVSASPEGSWGELLPQESLRCQDEKFRRWEWSLRSTIFWWDQIGDDRAFEPWFDIRWRVDIGDFGVAIPRTHGDNRGSFVWDPPLKDLERDLDKLHFRSLSVDRDATRADVELAGEIFGDLLPPRIHGAYWWTTGLTQDAAYLVGIEQLMFAMMDQPEQVHRLMRFLRDEMLHRITWFEREGLLSTNARGGQVGSGGIGYTDQIAGDLAGAARLRDMWGLGESQETVGISPQMFGEFVLPYQMPLLEKFGLAYYGCCEQLEQRIDLVLGGVPNLRRVSVAPQANQEVLAEKLGRNYVFCRKADPVPVCVEFCEESIRRDLRRTLAAAGHLPLELILKDTHTVRGETWRIGRWVQIAREEIDHHLQKN